MVSQIPVAILLTSTVPDFKNPVVISLTHRDSGFDK